MDYRNVSHQTVSSVITNQPYLINSRNVSHHNHINEPLHKSVSQTGPACSSKWEPLPLQAHNNLLEMLHNDDLEPQQKRDRLTKLLHYNKNRSRHWQSGLCHCIQNKRHCFLQLILGPIYQGCQAERMGENFFTGCCMGGFLGLPIISWIPCLTPFNSMLSLRSKIRERHNIIGALCDDWWLYCCCMGSCANCQVYNELDQLGYPPSMF